jgi:hypothetical protein
MTVIYNQSLRFFPTWNQYGPHQVVGFIEMVCHILEKKSIVKNWVELGSFIGESSNILLGFRAIKHIDCVDISKTLLDHLCKRHDFYIKKNRCAIYNKASKEFLQGISKNHMDVVYIDADHSYECVKDDIEMSFEKLENGGFLCGHDYTLMVPGLSGVVNAVDEFSNKHGLPITKFIDSSWLMEKI